jgi:hypothetical protein
VEERVFILESYLKTMSYAHCRQSFIEKFRRQASVKSAIAKIIKNSAKQVHLWTRIVIGRSQCQHQGYCKILLKFYPYRMQVFHQLIPGDYAKRVNYCRWFRTLIRSNICVLDQVFFTDDAWFHLSG